MKTIIYTHKNQVNRLSGTRIFYCFMFLILFSSKLFSQTRPGTSPIIFNKSLNEPPKTIMPMCNSDVILSVPQNIIFTWLDPSASMQLGNSDLPNGVQEYILKIVEIIGNQSANDAIKYPTIPPFFEKTILGTSYIYGPADSPLKPNTKYAYTVTVKYNPKQYQNNGVSDVCMFTCKAQQMSANTSPTRPNPGSPNYGIVLLDPIQGKKIAAGYGLTFQWKPAINNADYYLLEFTDSYSQNNKIKDWSNLTDELFTGKNSFYASSPDPSNDVKNGVITETKYIMSPSWTNGLGKIAWRIVACDKNNKHIDSSHIETYEIVEDNADTKIKDFMMCGFPVHILSIQNKDTSNYSCTGEFYLWEGGPKIVSQFNGLHLKPFMYNAKAKIYYWFATDGQLIINNLSNSIYPKNIVDLEPEQNTDGNFSLKMTKLKLVANVDCKYNESKQIFDIIQDKSTSKVAAELTWLTDWFNWQPNQSFTEDDVELTTENKYMDFTFADKFVGSKLYFEKDAVVNTATKGGIAIMFNGVNKMASMPADGSVPVPTYFLLKGFSVSANLSGNIDVPNTRPTSQLGNQFIDFAIPFTNKQNMNFKTKVGPLNWNLNNDGSVMGKVEDVIVHLGNGQVDGKDLSNKNTGILVPSFKTTVKYSTIQTGAKDFVLTHQNVVFNSGGGFQTNGYSKTDNNFEFDLGGFYAKSKDAILFLSKNKLNEMILDGNMYVPFFNKYADYSFDVTNEKLGDASISFNDNENFLIGSAGSAQSFSVEVSAGTLLGNSIQFSPFLTIYNNEGKGVTVNNLKTGDFYITPDGNVSFDKSGTSSISFINQKTANYYKFDYNLNKVGVKKIDNTYDYKFSFRGDLILGPKISTDHYKETYFIFHGKEPEMKVSNIKPSNIMQQIDMPKDIIIPKNTVIPKNIGTQKNGSYPNDESVENTENDNASIDFQDDGVDVSGDYEDGGQAFGGQFKLVKDDPTWGDYFSLSGHYYTKEPNATELNASMILGKIKNNSKNYTYWYFDFFQKNVVTIPVIPGILEINGFGGKTYFHMQATHDNVGKIIALAPNNANSLGIEAEALVRTEFDQGRTFHAHTSISIGFFGWSLGLVTYKMQGELLAVNDNSSGLLHSTVNAFFDYKNKSFNTTAAAWGNIYGMLCLNTNLDFKINPDGVDVWVGTPDDPLTMSVMCNVNTNAWAHIYNNGIGIGFGMSQTTGCVGLDAYIASACAGLSMSADGSAAIQFSPFNFTGNVYASGSAFGSVCAGICPVCDCWNPTATVSGNLKLNSINPFSAHGSLLVDLKHIPNFYVSGTIDTGFPYFHLDF